MYKDYLDFRDTPGYEGALALVYAICSKKEITVQDALDRYKITPYIEIDEMREN